MPIDTTYSNSNVLSALSLKRSYWMGRGATGKAPWPPLELPLKKVLAFPRIRAGNMVLVAVVVQLYRNMMGTGTSGRHQLIIWKDRLNGTRLIEVGLQWNMYCWLITLSCQ